MKRKRAWLLVRGLIRSYKHWGDFPEYFQKLVPEDMIFYIDLPGNGVNFRQKSPTSIVENAEMIRDQALKKSYGYELNVVAISMGAMVVVEWMHRHPGEVNQAFLINTSASNLSTPLERFQISNIFKYILQNQLTDRETNILKVSSNNLERAKAWAPIFAEEAKEHPVTKLNGIRQIFAAGKYPFPKKNPGNVQIIVSENDRLVKSSCSKAIAELWKAPLTIHPTAGHDLPMDEPQWLSEKIITLAGP